MRLLSLAFLFGSLLPSVSKAEVLDTMLVSRMTSDPFAYVWSHYGESAEVIREQLQLNENAKLSFFIQTQPGTQKLSMTVKFCTKNPPLKCLKDNFPTLTFNSSKSQKLIQDLSLVNLKKDTLIHMANLAKANNLVIVTRVTEHTPWWLSDRMISEKVFDFNTMAQNESVRDILLEQSASIQLQFLNKH